MKYSVLMSLYNKENPAYLVQSIESMINQTLPPDEIVIVEDGPLGNELKSILEKYKEQHSNLFKLVKSEKNIGLGRALNLGLKFCENELVARMDTDDISLPNRCKKQVERFQMNQNLGILGTYIDEFFEDPTQIISSRKVPSTHEDIYEFSKRRSAFNHPTVMYKKSVVLGLGGYSNLRRNQDVDLFGRMLFNGIEAMNLEESLLLFRSNESLSKRRKSWENSWSYIKTINKFRKIGFSSTKDVVIVALAQSCLFVCPVFIQNLIYKKFLRG